MPPSSSGYLSIDHVGQVAAVVEDHVQRLAVGEVQRLLDAPVELFVVHALSRHRPGCPVAAIAAAASSCVLKMLQLAPGDLGAELDERFDQHGRLDRHVQAAGDAGAGERLGLAVLLAEGHQAGHLVLGQHDLAAAEIGQGQIGDFVRADVRWRLGHEEGSRVRGSGFRKPRLRRGI